jgi:hypothetical protein
MFFFVQLLAGGWAGFCLLLGTGRLMGHFEGWPARTLCLAGGLAAVWLLIPALLELLCWLTAQLPLVLLALVGLFCLARPRHFF